MPAVTDEPTITVQGSVSDISPVNVTVNGVWAFGPGIGFFLIYVQLSPGHNPIVVRAVDAAGNVAVVTVEVEFIPPDHWFVHPEKHFRIPVPYGWQALGNLSQAGTPVDLYMFGLDPDANIIVVSERQDLEGATWEANAVLKSATDDLATRPGFRFLGPSADAVIQGHTAATAFVTWEPANYSVDQIITIVLGPEHGMYWALIGTFYPENVTAVGPLINGTMASFEVLPGERPAILASRDAILVGASAATVVEGGILGFLVVRGSRRRMPWDRAYL